MTSPLLVSSGFFIADHFDIELFLIVIFICCSINYSPLMPLLVNIIKINISKSAFYGEIAHDREWSNSYARQS